MPRVSIRKLFVCFFGISSCLLLALNVQQRATGLFTSSLTPTGPSGPPAPAFMIKPAEYVGKPRKKLDGKNIFSYLRSMELEKSRFFKYEI